MSMMFATAAMGTRFEIVIDDAESTHTRAVGELAIAEIERLHRQLSFFASDSMVSHINRCASLAPVRVDADMFSLLCDAQTVWRESRGRFDITRGTGMDSVHLDESARTIRFLRDGISIDLGGIAKGHAVDRAAAVLREHGITSALVHGGTSSISAVGAPTGGASGWRIAIAPSLAHEVVLCDETMSVSSSALRNHIIDPATRTFTTHTRTAAITGPCARLGDAWSTAAAVAGSRPEGLGPEWRCIIE
jgi:thiamine biosynthesis lipoprotein